VAYPENLRDRVMKALGRIEVRTGLAASILAGTLLAAAAAPDSATEAFAPSPQVFAQVKTPAGRAKFVQTYCQGCHNAKAKAGGLVLEGVDTANLAGNDETWEKVIRRLGAGEMPPRTAFRHPDPAVAQTLVASLIADLDGPARKKPFAGRTVVRRLNRTEYGNAVRDLLDVDFPFAADLPADGTAVGFDNIADSLSMSPLLLEGYLKVAHRVSDLAVGEGDASPVNERFPATKSQAVWQGEGMPFETRGGVLVKKYFPRDGEYDLRAFLNDTALTPTEGVRFFHTRMAVRAGVHTFIVTFLQSNAEREGPIPNLAGAGGRALGGPLDIQGSAVRPHLVMLLDGKRIKDFEIAGPNSGEAIQERSGPPTLARAEITGPYNAGPPAETPSRARVLICRPKTAAQEPACANRILATLLRRAWRRDVTAADTKPFLATYARERPNGDFAAAIAMALRDILVSPGFLFRLEFDPSSARPGQAYRVSDFDLASRLSFFLWSSIPDDRLLDIAARGRLHDPAVLDGETRRLLADARADAMIDNFAAQWLSLRDVEDAKPDEKTYPEFDPALRDSFETETRLFLRSIMRENRSVMDVVNANYTFVNDRLAGIYGIPNVRGPGFRRIELAANSPRGGILGMGAILMVTSHANKTSPVLRGKWILTNLLDSPLHPPPAGVPPLDVSPVKGRILTTREQVERHRANAVCATCHSRMDPYGFSLENFDVIGRWRDKDEGGPVDATATLANGQTFTGPSGLRQMLATHSDQFVGATVSRMMTYALGRPVEAGDMPAVRGIVDKTVPGDHKFDDIVLGIVHSAPFLMKQAVGGPS
jgi:mono/diheme cytochrome c family protein